MNKHDVVEMNFNYVIKNNFFPSTDYDKFKADFFETVYFTIDLILYYFAITSYLLYHFLFLRFFIKECCPSVILNKCYQMAAKITYQ